MMPQTKDAEDFVLQRPENVASDATDVIGLGAVAAKHPQAEQPTGDIETQRPRPLQAQPALPSGKLLYSLYLSHFLSTWNSRWFEFGSVLFIAAIFPGTLMPMSVHALFRSGSAFLLSPLIGRYIDETNRLGAVRLSIVMQRIAIIVSCVVLFLMLQFGQKVRGLKPGGMVFVIFLAIIEKLSAIMNLISVERDWAVVIANNDIPVLQTLNARMRRIDLICKLIGPLAVAFLESFGGTRIAIITTFGINLLSLPIEYFSILFVYIGVPALHVRSSPLDSETGSHTPTRGSFLHRLTSYGRSFRLSVRSYFRHHIALPSISLSILYFTVLSFGGQMIVYLISIGFKSSVIGGIRTASVLFELSATFLAPWVMARIGPVRGALWFINWQIFSLVALSGMFLGVKSKLIAALGLVVSVILSRVGLWGFDLCVQVLVQQEVEEAARGSFSSVEASLQNAFEGLSFVSTIVFSHPDQFRIPATMSVAAVATAGAIYAAFVRRTRGHLLHKLTCAGRSRR